MIREHTQWDDYFRVKNFQWCHSELVSESHIRGTHPLIPSQEGMHSLEGKDVEHLADVGHLNQEVKNKQMKHP